MLSAEPWSYRSLSVDRAVQIDVEIQDDLDDGDWNPNSYSDESTAAPPEVVHNFQEMSGKLSMLNLLTGQAKESLTAPPPPSSAANSEAAARRHRQQLDQFHDLLLEIFERTVLPTHKCRYAQFLWFYARAHDPVLTERFLVLLASKAFDGTAPSIIRISASAYLSSFVARAAFLDEQTVLHCVMLNGWALKYVEENEDAPKAPVGKGALAEGSDDGELGTAKDAPDLRRHYVFYSVVQSLLYMEIDYRA
ncbi:hypothetical protein HDU96_007338 [Phlyctochytrium bullatum]|nr:hypothetical protein HDU96_007338 [Phlyctochytrium bullatum]